MDKIFLNRLVELHFQGAQKMHNMYKNVYKRVGETEERGMSSRDIFNHIPKARGKQGVMHYNIISVN